MTSAPLGLLRRLWQCMDMDRRESTSAPIMHVGLESIFGEFTSTPLRLLLCLWHCVDTVSRELTATPIIHLGQELILER